MPNPYRLAINMAGAVSAGAYTAGVLDFLIEALDCWESAKAAGEPVPRHSVSIEILSGASAGAMCSALGAVSLFDPPNPCPGLGNPWRNPTRMYRSWVNEIDIGDLIATDDLVDNTISSLLNSNTLDRIADTTLTAPTPLTERPYVSPTLNLLMTLTNLRGVPYSVDFADLGSFEEHSNYFADQMQFRLATGTVTAAPPLDCVVDLTNSSDPGWTVLRNTAKASGAVPAMLRPRILQRTAAAYENRQWTVSADPDTCSTGACEETTTIPPAWQLPPAPPPVTFDNVYVDGGITNNNPFECARRYLAAISGAQHNERDPLKAAASVLTIAPFPGNDTFNLSWDASAHATLFGSLPMLLDVLLGQSRFLGESLSLLRSSSASRYVVAPSDPSAASGKPALQGGALGAFGGFFSKGFRDHDYHLGRYNCQRFLQHWFVLPCENPLIAEGLPLAQRSQLLDAFRVVDASSDPPRQGLPTQAWMPLIPLCGRLSQALPLPPPQAMKQNDLDMVLDGVFNRLTEVLKIILRPHLPLSALTTGVVAKAVVKSMRSSNVAAIEANLRDSRCL
jgi:hypothetical protein